MARQKNSGNAFVRIADNGREADLSAARILVLVGNVQVE